MDNIRLKLSPPWITYVNEITALFGNDPDIHITYYNENPQVKLFVDNDEKATALAFLLPETKEIGNITLKITIIPANNFVNEVDFGSLSNKQIFDIAFNNNPVYAYSKEVVGFFSNILTYIIFKNRVVQFFNDNLNDIHGLISTLYENLAREVFEDANLNGVFFNTDIEEKVYGVPTEWP